MASDAASPLQSAISNSTAVPGLVARIACTVAANPDAPPSARSSRATHVIDRVREAERGDRVGDALRLVGVERERLARVDLAEAARPRAAVAVDHERRGAIGPALVDVRAAGLLAHGVQVEPAGQLLQLEVAVVEAGPHAHPVRGACGVERDRDAEQPHRRTTSRPSRTARRRAPRDVLALDHGRAEHLGEARDDTVDDRVHLDAAGRAAAPST